VRPAHQVDRHCAAQLRGSSTVVCSLACIAACLPERQHQHLATLAVAQGEVAAEARNGPNHRQHPLTHEPELHLETPVVSDTGKAREPPEHTTPFGSPGTTPAFSGRRSRASRALAAQKSLHFSTSSLEWVSRLPLPGARGPG
jgi:hypothetical protein